MPAIMAIGPQPFASGRSGTARDSCLVQSSFRQPLEDQPRRLGRIVPPANLPSRVPSGSTSLTLPLCLDFLHDSSGDFEFIAEIALIVKQLQQQILLTSRHR